MRGVREGWFKECKIDTVKVMSGACGNSREWKVIKVCWGCDKLVAGCSYSLPVPFISLFLPPSHYP